MIRKCDGTDPNLTREIPAQARLTTGRLSPWNRTARPGMIVICCGCGLVFDDAERRVVWPHEPI